MDGRGCSFGNKGRGRKTGWPKLKGLSRGDEGGLSSSMGKRLISSPIWVGIELESSGGEWGILEKRLRVGRGYYDGR